MSRTEIAELGEFGLIERIKTSFQLRNSTSSLGIGDDAAIIQPPTGMEMVISTDLLLEGVHFDLSFAPLSHVGYKAVVVNLSDIAAMNAVPSQIVVSVGLSNRFSVEAVDELYQGISKACENYKVDLVGGDTTASHAGLVLSVTAIGFVATEKVVKRSGAKPGDVLCVTGDLGAAYMGLNVLTREKVAFTQNPAMQPEFAKEHEYLIRRQLMPEARTDFIHELAELNVVPNSMMDISDGLASELLHISKQSEVGVWIFGDKLPLEADTKLAASEFSISPTTAAMNGGEDYELLFTLPPQMFEKIKHLPDVSPIGIVKPKEEGANLITPAGQKIPIEAQGWKHF